MTESNDVSSRLLAHLDAAGIDYQRFDHDAVGSAAEAAAARGTPLELGAKAILLKINTEFAIFALSAERAVRSAKIRRGLRVSRTRFASRDELLDMTGLLPGSVPPFGEPILPFPLYADPSLLERPRMVFTAASRNVSVAMATADYRRLATPTPLDFAR